MKTRYSFNFRMGQMERFNEIVPNSLRPRFIRQFIKNEYLAPVNINELEEITDGEVFPVLLDEVSFNRIEMIQEQLEKQFKINVSKSAIMRDVFDSILTTYKVAIPEPERKNIPFNVPVGITKKLDKYIPSHERSATISEFILNDYSIKGVDAAYLKQKPPEGLEMKMFSLELKAIEELDSLAEKLNSKRSYVFRNVLIKMLDMYESSNTLQDQLKYELKNVVGKLTEYMSVAEIQQFIAESTEKRGEMDMVYEEKKEVLLSPGNEREVEYDTNQ